MQALARGLNCTVQNANNAIFIFSKKRSYLEFIPTLENVLPLLYCPSIYAGFSKANITIRLYNSSYKLAIFSKSTAHHYVD